MCVDFDDDEAVTVTDSRWDTVPNGKLCDECGRAFDPDETALWESGHMGGDETDACANCGDYEDEHPVMETRHVSWLLSQGLDPSCHVVVIPPDYESRHVFCETYVAGPQPDAWGPHVTCRHCLVARNWLHKFCRTFLYGGIDEDFVSHWDEAVEYRSWAMARWIVGRGYGRQRSPYHQWRRRDGSLLPVPPRIPIPAGAQ